MLPPGGSIWMGVDSRNHLFAPWLSPAWWTSLRAGCGRKRPAPEVLLMPQSRQRLGDYLTQSVFKVVFQKSIPTKIRQLILYTRNGRDKSTNLWGSWLLQHDFKNALCEIREAWSPTPWDRFWANYFAVGRCSWFLFGRILMPVHLCYIMHRFYTTTSAPTRTCRKLHIKTLIICKLSAWNFATRNDLYW